MPAVHSSELAWTSGGTVSTTEPPVGASIDANGNPTADGTRSCEWDARNQFVRRERGHASQRMAHEASDLLLMKRRAYDTTLARWLSEDPLGTQDGPHLSAYVANSPLQWIDPDGTIAMRLPPSPFQPNGNLGDWFGPQDGICSQPMGFLGYNGAPCLIFRAFRGIPAFRGNGPRLTVRTRGHALFWETLTGGC